MTPVREKLTGRRYAILGKNGSGEQTKLYISNEVDGLLHINIRGKEIWVNTNDLIDRIRLLNEGDPNE